MLRSTNILRHGFAVDVLSVFRGIKAILRAPVKHFKSMMEPTGVNYSTQTNITAEGFDEVAGEWQAHFGMHPYDLMIYNYFESTQLTNFGTIDNPNIVFTADVPFRYIGCTGPQNEEDYESHQLFWMMLREGPMQRCLTCGQVFKLVRLRDENSSDMNYYTQSFNKLWMEDLGESDHMSHWNPFRSNTHFEPTFFETPQDTMHFNVNPDDHDRILTDPAYRIQRHTECENKAKVYEYAMEQYEKEKIESTLYRNPITKKDYQNLIEAEVQIKRLDRLFRKITKFHARKYVDPLNHPRREKRMLQRSEQRWDNSYTIFTGSLTEEEQRYRDYFETDLSNFKEDEQIEQHLDRQEIISESRYKLSKFDFQEGYTKTDEDDQSSYIEKKIFKFQFRRALDSHADFTRRNARMIQSQKKRFEANKTLQLIQGFLSDPVKYSSEYIKMISEESVLQYKDYFQSENDKFDDVLFGLNKDQFLFAFENTQIAISNKDTFETFPLPQWNKSLGFWPNAVEIAKEVLTVGGKLEELEATSGVKALQTTALQTKK